MFLHKKLFQKKEKSDSQNVEQVIKAIQQQQLSFQQKARCKERNDPISLNELMRRFFPSILRPTLSFTAFPGAQSPRHILWLSMPQEMS